MQVLLLVALLAVGLVVNCVHALTQQEAEEIITAREVLWGEGYAAKDWEFMVNDLYCPDAVMIPYQGSEVFVTMDDAPALWNAEWAPTGNNKSKTVAVTVIAPTVGIDEPMILVVGETISPTLTDNIDNWSSLYAICDDSGDYKILVRTIIVHTHWDVCLCVTSLNSCFVQLLSIEAFV